MAGVRALLREPRLVTLAGSGGCGKTHLALEVARGILREPLDSYPDGVWPGQHQLVARSVVAAAAIQEHFAALLGKARARGSGRVADLRL